MGEFNIKRSLQVSTRHKWNPNNQAELFHRTHMHGFPGIKAKYNQTQSDWNAFRSKVVVNSKSGADDLERDSLDMGNKPS